MRQSYASIRKIGVQALRLLTIWARQNLQLLTSSKSGWRALVQVMLPLVHVVLKWPEDSGRPAYMGGVSPVLYRLLYRHDLSKYLHFVQISAGAYIFTISWGKVKNLSQPKCPITAPKIRTWSQKLSKSSYNTLDPLNRGRHRFWPGRWKLIKFSSGEYVGGGREGGAEIDAAGLSYHIYWRRVWGGGGGGQGEVRTNSSLY